MGEEIERKYLVEGDGWRAQADAPVHIRQAYLALTDKAEIRVRILDGERARLTIKSARPAMSRTEVETDLPLEEAEHLFDLAVATLEKDRHRLETEGERVWEVDVFRGALEGLRLAEIELDDDSIDPARPAWLGEDVTGDPRYYNARLASEGKP